MYPVRSLSRRFALGLAACLVLAPAFHTGAALDGPTPTKPIGPLATTEQEIDQRLEGKFFFIRGFYLDDKIEYDTTGKIVGTPQKGSFALSGIDVKKVRTTKHSIVIEGDRVGLHFFGGLPYEDDTKPFEQIKVSKKPVEITIDRLVIEPEKKKKKKEKEEADAKAAAAAKAKAASAAKPAAATDMATSGVANPPDVTFDEPAATPDAKSAAKTDVTATATAATMPKMPTEPPHPDPKESWMQLSKAVEVIFAPGLDETVIATLPEYWQTYFATKQGKINAERIDNSVLHPGNGVVSPRLLSSLDPASNDYAQRANIAGMTLLSTVVGASGEPTHVTIVRPIGFGLDEKAVDAVTHAHFKPGLRDGQPVPVIVNLQVTFRIYNDLTRPQPGGTQPTPPASATPASNPSPSHGNGKEVASVNPQ